MAEGGAGGRNVRRVLGPVDWWFRFLIVFLGDDVVDRFFHM
jgi:hypothetical protein